MAVTSQAWDCPKCGTMQIIGDLENCPVCGAPRPSDVATEPTEAGVTGAGGAAAESVGPPADSESAPSSPTTSRSRSKSSGQG